MSVGGTPDMRDGSEELFDEAADKNELHNQAGNAAHMAVKQRLAKFMPQTSAPPAPERTAFDFDFKTYTYKKKVAK